MKTCTERLLVLLVWKAESMYKTSMYKDLIFVMENVTSEEFHNKLDEI